MDQCILESGDPCGVGEAGRANEAMRALLDDYTHVFGDSDTTKRMLEWGAILAEQTYQTLTGNNGKLIRECILEVLTPCFIEMREQLSSHWPHNFAR